MNKRQLWFSLKKYWHFRKDAVNIQGVHSPYLYAFIQDTLINQPELYPYKDIEVLRSTLLKNHKEIKVTDFGAGSKLQASHSRKISRIASHSLKPKKQARFLSSIVYKKGFKNILELGTSLGVTTAYLAVANPEAKVISIEGDEKLCNLAQDLFSALKLGNIQLLHGRFSAVLPLALTTMAKIDFLFIDGHHSYKATKAYYAFCKPHLSKNSIVVFDDIYWSEEMTKVWEEIKNMEEVTMSLDLYHMGLIFFSKTGVKQHYKYRF